MQQEVLNLDPFISYLTVYVCFLKHDTNMTQKQRYNLMKSMTTNLYTETVPISIITRETVVKVYMQLYDRNGVIVPRLVETR